MCDFLYVFNLELPDTAIRHPWTTLDVPTRLNRELTAPFVSVKWTCVDKVLFRNERLAGKMFSEKDMDFGSHYG